MRPNDLLWRTLHFMFSVFCSSGCKPVFTLFSFPCLTTFSCCAKIGEALWNYSRLSFNSNFAWYCNVNDNGWFFIGVQRFLSMSRYQFSWYIKKKYFLNILKYIFSLPASLVLRSLKNKLNLNIFKIHGLFVNIDFTMILKMVGFFLKS